jgi:1,4-dihydroxy-2-naphthoate octaprenyltransferase
MVDRLRQAGWFVIVAGVIAGLFVWFGNNSSFLVFVSALGMILSGVLSGLVFLGIARAIEASEDACTEIRRLAKSIDEERRRPRTGT